MKALTVASWFVFVSIVYGQNDQDQLLFDHLIVNYQTTIRECFKSLRRGEKFCPLTHELYAQQSDNGPVGCNSHVVVDTEGAVWAVLTAEGWYFLAPLWEDEILPLEEKLHLPILPSELWKVEKEISSTSSETLGPPPPGTGPCEIHISLLDPPLEGQCSRVPGCVWVPVTSKWQVHCEKCSSRMRACGPPPPNGFCNHKRRHELLMVTYECRDDTTGVPCTSAQEHRVVAQRWVATRRNCAGKKCTGRIWRPV